MKRAILALLLLASPVFAARSILPVADQVGDLGSASQKWNNIYAYNLAAVLTNYLYVTNSYVITNVYSITNFVGILNGSNITDFTIGTGKLNFVVVTNELDPVAATNNVKHSDTNAWEVSTHVGLATQSYVTNVITVATNKLVSTNAVTYLAIQGFTNSPVTWNSDFNTLDFTMIDGTVLQLGQENYTVIRNTSGATISNGMIVMTVEANGFYSGAKLANATNNWNSTLSVIGVATEDIAINDIGKITIVGNVNDFDTSALEEGSNLWLSATVPGRLTMDMPSVTNSALHQPFIGVCLRKSATVGRIIVDIQKIPHAEDIGAAVATDYNSHTNLTLALGAHGGELDPVYTANSNAYVKTNDTGFLNLTGATINIRHAVDLSEPITLAQAQELGAASVTFFMTTNPAVGITNFSAENTKMFLLQTEPVFSSGTASVTYVVASNYHTLGWVYTNQVFTNFGSGVGNLEAWCRENTAGSGSHKPEFYFIATNGGTVYEFAETALIKAVPAGATYVQQDWDITYYATNLPEPCYGAIRYKSSSVSSTPLVEFIISPANVGYLRMGLSQTLVLAPVYDTISAHTELVLADGAHGGELESAFTNWIATNTDVKVESDPIFTNWLATGTVAKTLQQVLDTGNVATNLIYAGGYQGLSNAFDVGSATSPAQHVYVGTNSLYVGTNRFSATVSGQPLWNGSLTFLDGIARGQTSNNTASLTVANQRIGFLERNLLLTWVELEIQNHLTRVALADGYKDYFYDQAGINLTASSNQTWNSGGYYSWAKYGQGSLVMPTAQYKLNDSAANTVVTDSVGTNNGVAPANTDTITMPGKYGLAYTNASGFMTIPNLGIDFATGDWTVMAWVKASVWPADTMAFFGVSGFMRIGVYQSGKFFVSQGGGASESSATLSANTVYHLAVVHKNSTTRFHFYVDGNPSGDADDGDISGASATSLAIGAARVVSPLEYFVGWIDDVRIFDSALSDAEVLAIFESGVETAGGVNTGGNMALVATNSVATIIPFDPVDARLGLWLNTNSGEVVMNTDLKGYVSSDNGTNFDEVTFTDSTRYSTNASDVIWWGAPTNLTGTGSNMLWKVQTLNTNTAGRIYGAFLQAK